MSMLEPSAVALLQGIAACHLTLTKLMLHLRERQDILEVKLSCRMFNVDDGVGVTNIVEAALSADDGVCWYVECLLRKDLLRLEVTLVHDDHGQERTIKTIADGMYSSIENFSAALGDAVSRFSSSDVDRRFEKE